MPGPAAEPSIPQTSHASPPNTPERLRRIDLGREFAIEAARLCADLRCRDVKVLDVAGLSPLCDFFVLATAVSPRQMKSVAQDVEELGDERGMPPLRKVRSGEPNDRWVAVDLVDVVVHLFNDEARLFYDLDNLWGDAKSVEWVRPEDAKAGGGPPAT